MPLILLGLLYAVLLFIIFFEGQPDTPQFYSLPHTPTDFFRILIHSLEFLVVTWFFMGPIIVNPNMAAGIEVFLAFCLGVASALSKKVDSRFARTGNRIAFWFGLLSLPYVFLFAN